MPASPRRSLRSLALLRDVYLQKRAVSHPAGHLQREAPIKELSHVAFYLSSMCARLRPATLFSIKLEQNLMESGDVAVSRSPADYLFCMSALFILWRASSNHRYFPCSSWACVWQNTVHSHGCQLCLSASTKLGRPTTAGFGLPGIDLWTLRLVRIFLRQVWYGSCCFFFILVRYIFASSFTCGTLCSSYGS